MANILALLSGGKSKGGGSMGGMGDKKPARPEEDMARDAFAALKDDDEEGFVQAFLGAVEACKSSDYDDEDQEEEGPASYREEA
jgi:hypothetical protein